jgi:hypothetical protein
MKHDSAQSDLPCALARKLANVIEGCAASQIPDIQWGSLRIQLFIRCSQAREPSRLAFESSVMVHA